MSKKLTMVAVLVSLVLTSVASAASVAAYADGKYKLWLSAVTTIVAPKATRPGGPKWGGFYFNGLKADSVRCPRLAVTGAVACTLDIPTFMPFINASASTVTAQFKVFEKTGTSLQGLGFANDSLAMWIPGFGSRFIFTVASADTPCFFHVIGLNYGFND